MDLNLARYEFILLKKHFIQMVKEKKYVLYCLIPLMIIFNKCQSPHGPSSTALTNLSFQGLRISTVLLNINSQEHRQQKLLYLLML